MKLFLNQANSTKNSVPGKISQFNSIGANHNTGINSTKNQNRTNNFFGFNIQKINS